MRFASLVLAVMLAACSGDNPYARVESIERAPHFQDRVALAEAWKLPVAEAYAEDGFEYQANPSLCGPTSIANLLQSAGGTDKQDEVLRDSGVFNIFGLLPGGVTLDLAAAILEKETGKHVTVLRDLDAAAFREHMRHTNDPRRRYIANFHRGPLFGRGHGHFSPILGYLADEDEVFVGDVNDEYKPWLAKSERLREAVNTIDGATGMSRGLLMVEDISGEAR
jgi:phytochelatin synthase